MTITIFFHGFNALTLENNFIYSNVYTFDICTLLYSNYNSYLHSSYISSFFIAAVEGYIHLLSLIKTAANSGNTNSFDCKLQTSNDKSVRLVCYSLRKGKVCNKRLPVSTLWKLLAQRKVAKKYLNADTEDHCIHIKACKNYSCWSFVLPIQSINGKSSAHCKANLRSRHVWDCGSQSENLKANNL